MRYSFHCAHISIWNRSYTVKTRIFNKKTKFLKHIQSHFNHVLLYPSKLLFLNIICVHIILEKIQHSIICHINGKLEYLIARVKFISSIAWFPAIYSFFNKTTKVGVISKHNFFSIEFTKTLGAISDAYLRHKKIIFAYVWMIIKKPKWH